MMSARRLEASVGAQAASAAAAAASPSPSSILVGRLVRAAR